MKEHLKRHAGSYARGLCYVMISALSVWGTAIGDKSGDELFQTLADRWPALVLLSLLAVFTTIRAQLDQHIGNVQKKKDAADFAQRNPPANPPVNSPNETKPQP